jgi:AraC-like DNA-binding protein
MTGALMMTGQISHIEGDSMIKDTRLIKPTIQAQLVADLLQGVESTGGDVRMVLEKAGVNPDILHNLNTRISVEIYSRILDSVRKHLKDEMLGFMDRPIPPKAFPVYCEAATGYPDYQSIIRFANDFYGLLTDEFSWSIEAEPSGHLTSLYMDFRNGHAHYKRFIIEFLMVTTYRAGNWLIGEHYPVKSVHFTFPEPDHVEKYHYLLSNRVFFNAARNRIVFHTSVLNRPVIRNRSEVPAFLRSSMGWFLLNPDTYPYSRMVRQALSAKDLSEGFPNFEHLARSLNISHQHLWRKLNHEGTSYQNIKNQLRRDTAIHFLVYTPASIHDISEKVGYIDERPFYRMFTQWTGMSPGEYRRMFQATSK